MEREVSSEGVLECRVWKVSKIPMDKVSHDEKRWVMALNTSKGCLLEHVFMRSCDESISDAIEVG